MTPREKLKSISESPKQNIVKNNRRRIKYRKFIRLKNKVLLFYLNLKDYLKL